MRNVDVVVFDKTGTLTEGHPTVIGWLWAQGQEEHYKDVLLAAESTSDHPLAEAIVTALEGEEQVIPAHLDGFENITGKGVRVAYQGAEYWVGSHKLLKDYQANLSDILADMLTQYESDGNSIVYFGRENDLLAVIAIKDQLRVTSMEAIRELRTQDIEIRETVSVQLLPWPAVWVSCVLWPMPCPMTKRISSISCSFRVKRLPW